MPIAVADAARALRVDDSRVRAMLRDGLLAGEKIGSVWVVDGEDVARRVARGGSPGGRPFSAAGAWGALNMLEGGRAPWLEAVHRSRVRQGLRRLSGQSANHWSAALARRQRKL